MKTNMGVIDRILRILLAITFIILFITNVVSGTIAMILLILGIVFSFTGMIGFCPLYIPLKLNSNKTKIK